MSSGFKARATQLTMHGVEGDGRVREYACCNNCYNMLRLSSLTKVHDNGQLTEKWCTGPASELKEHINLVDDPVPTETCSRRHVISQDV